MDRIWFILKGVGNLSLFTYVLKLLDVFLNALPMWLGGTLSYVMVRRLLNNLAGKCLRYFRCLRVVYGCVITFIRQ